MASFPREFLAAFGAASAICLWPAVGSAQGEGDGIDPQTLARLEELRMDLAGQVQLYAYDLLDEMVYGWTEKPIFGQQTDVIVANVSVPVGLSTQMVSLVENHLTSLLLQNPKTNMRLVHCPGCSATVVHSGPQGTVVSRGMDNPETLEALGLSGSGTESSRHALYVDFEAEGTFLVMRARLTKIDKDLPVIWARTLSTSGNNAALLRQPEHLKSAAQARQEYIDTLKGRGPIFVPLRFGLTSFARGYESNILAPPLIWLQSGAEMSLSQARGWSGSIILGYTNIPGAYSGIMAQGRISRLVSGSSRALNRPNLYGFVGASVFRLSGLGAAAFNLDAITVENALALLTESGNISATYGGWHVGMDLRIGNRVGISVFLESLPALRDSQNLGAFFDAGSIFYFQGLGTEVSFWF